MEPTSRHSLLAAYDENDTDPEEPAAPSTPPPHRVAYKASKPLLLRYLALISVPLLWGTFTPSMKVLLDDTRRSPPVILTNLVSHSAGSVALALLWACEALRRRECMPSSPEDAKPGGARRLALLASAELGVYLFFGQLTQLMGLLGTSATVNAILVQSSVVFVPLLEGAACGAGLLECARQMAPSMLALGGIVMITLGPGLVGEADTHVGEQSTFGVLCSLTSALFYALHTMRISAHSAVDPTVQATGQVVVNAVLDVVALPVASRFGRPISRWFHHADALALQRLGAVALWNGVMIVGATTWAMSYAQSALRASTAALAYAMEPLFAALLARLLLHDAITPIQLCGGALVVGANLLAGMRQADVEDEPSAAANASSRGPDGKVQVLPTKS
jgi:drug/metabolite transporter (DMT)-like permease